MTNWGGNDAVPMREYCEYLAALIDHEIVFEEVPGLTRSRGIDVNRREGAPR